MTFGEQCNAWGHKYPHLDSVNETTNLLPRGPGWFDLIFLRHSCFNTHSFTSGFRIYIWLFLQSIVELLTVMYELCRFLGSSFDCPRLHVFWIFLFPSIWFELFLLVCIKKKGSNRRNVVVNFFSYLRIKKGLLIDYKR